VCFKVKNPLYEEFSCDDIVEQLLASTVEECQNSLEDRYSDLYSQVAKPSRFSQSSSENSIQELDAQLSKFNKDQKIEEESTHSFLAKVNARITSHYEANEDDFFFTGTAKNQKELFTAEADSRFILQKTSNYYFPEINEG
jgi:hypothetical protein